MSAHADKFQEHAKSGARHQLPQDQTMPSAPGINTTSPASARMLQMRSMIDTSARMQQATQRQSEADRFLAQSAPAAPVQRKTMTDAGLDVHLGVANTRTRGKIIGSNAHNGIIYRDAPGAQVGSREEALSASSRNAAAVGRGVQTWADQGPGRKDRKGRIYTVEAFDNAGVPTLDPFIHETKFAYQDAKTESVGIIGTFYQHSNNMDGYVSAIIELPAEGPQASAAMKKGKEHVSADASIAEYESQHVPINGSVLAASAGQGPERFDAITKLVGEGARFNCVAAHAGNLTDHSRFYTKEGDNFRAIRFTDLYVVWANHFRGRYGITDEEVAATIRGKTGLNGTKRGNGQKQSVYALPLLSPGELGPQDYSLDGNAVVAGGQEGKIDQ